MVIDFHAHYPRSEAPDFPDKLVSRMGEAGIDLCCLCSAGVALGHVSNEEVMEASGQHPDRILPLGYVELGTDNPGDVERLVSEGYRGFKVTNPRGPYDEESFFPVYERMEESGLPVLVHTGILMRFPQTQGMRVSSEWMRPIKLDKVLRSFPGLNMVGAHLGAPWHEEASMMARIHPNYFVDLTGANTGGWRLNKTVDFFRYHFFWEGAWDKLVFGTDILSVNELFAARRIHDKIIRELDLPDEAIDKIYCNNAARLLGLDVTEYERKLQFNGTKGLLPTEV